MRKDIKKDTYRAVYNLVKVTAKANRVMSFDGLYYTNPIFDAMDTDILLCAWDHYLGYNCPKVSIGSIRLRQRLKRAALRVYIQSLPDDNIPDLF